MTVRMAHLREQGIDFAVFAADAKNHTDVDRSDLLHQLTMCARNAGLKVDKAALQYWRGRRLEFFGAPDLVGFLCSVGGISSWTHKLAL